MELCFLFFMHCLMVLHICTKFPENTSKGFRDTKQTRFPHLKFQNAIIPSKMKMELQFFISAYSLMVLYKSTDNISMDFRVTVKTLNIGTPRPATVVVLNMKQFNFTMK